MYTIEINLQPNETSLTERSVRECNSTFNNISVILVKETKSTQRKLICTPHHEWDLNLAVFEFVMFVKFST
jgi:hypothetical protein